MKEKKTNLLQVLARRALLVALDGAIVAFSFYFALLLRADGAVEASWWPHNRALLYANLPWIVAVYLLSFLAGRLYTILWKYAGERDLIRLAGMIAVPTGIVYLVNRCFIHGVLFNSANAMAAVLIFLFIGGSRLAWRLFLNHPLGERLRGNTSKDPNRPVMIVGAGEAGAWAINVCKTNTGYGHVIVAVDDDPNKLGQTIHGVPVRGTLEEIPDLCTRYNIHTIIVAIPTLKGNRLNHVIDLCVSTHCAVQMLSDPQLVGAGTPQQGAFRELNTADFLSREEVTLDTEKISGYLTGKTVLVTGGGGSIGSELCRQVMRFKPAKLLIFDIYENCAYELLMELQQKYGRDVPVTVLVGSIRDKARLDFTALTDHDCYPDWTTQSEWELLRTNCRLMNKDGELACLLAYEWTPNEYKYDYGHKNVYYRGDEGEIFRSGDKGGMTPTDLYNSIRSYKALCIPHHPAADWVMVSAATDWNFHDPEVQRAVEIYSRHAPFETFEARSKFTKNIKKMERCSVQDALARGYRMGFTAGSDSHQTEHGVEGGIVAAFVPALKREYVWDAIYDRLTYGTTGARILVSLKINSAPMGSEVKAIGDAPVTIEGSVLGTDTVTVELLRDNQVIQTWACAGNACDFTLEDTAGSDACYYLRVTQKDEHMAWSSPIWADRA